MKNKMLIGFIIALIVVGGGAFYGGMMYGKSSAVNSARLARQAGAGGQGGGQFNRAGKGGANFVSGDIIAMDNTSITVKNQAGGSKIVFLSGSTQISKFAAGSIADLAIGQTVTANGTTNADGSITAQMIQLRPARPTNATSTPQQ